MTLIESILIGCFQEMLSAHRLYVLEVYLNVFVRICLSQFIGSNGHSPKRLPPISYCQSNLLSEFFDVFGFYYIILHAQNLCLCLTRYLEKFRVAAAFAVKPRDFGKQNEKSESRLALVLFH